MGLGIREPKRESSVAKQGQAQLLFHTQDISNHMCALENNREAFKKKITYLKQRTHKQGEGQRGRQA